MKYWLVSHRWHLDTNDKLIEHAPNRLRRTDRRFVDLDEETPGCRGNSMVDRRTDVCGEGIVVKPVELIIVGKRGLVLPGVKSRGREYLRII